jgi:CubicO group peptidase (beta-lactamase class C family)
LTAAALVALLSLAGAARLPAQIPDSIARYVESELARQHIPGASVAVLQGNRVVLARGFGLANVELHVPASDSTIYQSGSMGKQFTAALVEMLVGEGRVHLGDTITRWFPEGARVWNDITVRHLLTHTSGVAEYTDSTFDARKDYSEDDLVRLAAARPLDFRPGERWSYSNTGYLLLGALIRRVTGRFYGDLLRDSVFQPLQMHDSRVISEADIVPNRAAGYRLEDGQLKNQEWVAPSLNTTADGALYLTLRDLIKWAKALDEGRVPSRAALDTAWTPVRLADGATYPYGFAWYLNDQRGHPRISHTGSWQGFKTVIARYPEYGITVIVLANLAEARVGAIAYGIAGMLEPPLQPPHRMSAAVSGGRLPPRPIPDLVRLIVAASDSSRITARFARFLTPADRGDYRFLLDASRQWTSLGCDAVGSRRISRLGADVAFVCHARSARTVRGGTAVSVLYTKDWRVAGIDTYQY